MASLFFRALFWAVLATLFACAEIEIEGKYGWAEKLPTWYRTRGFVARLFGLFNSGRPLTGYHSFMFFIPLMMLHSQFVMGVPWTIRDEVLTIAMYTSWACVWDYQWFVLNPAYAGKFNRTSVWWHAKSWWVMGKFPADYLFGTVFSLVLTAIVAWHSNEPDRFWNFAGLISLWWVYTFLLKGAAPLYRRWYSHMRERDDRGDADIFHN